jgi:DNA-binding NarL/FixJ family response regulator
VLLDISLPETTGFELLETIKKELPRLPVLVLSAYRGRSLCGACVSTGCRRILNKESASDSLIAAIRKSPQAGSTDAGARRAHRAGDLRARRRSGA